MSITPKMTMLSRANYGKLLCHPTLSNNLNHKMIKIDLIDLIVGERPNFMKIEPIINTIEKANKPKRII